ncbi:Poxvirus protein I5 [Arthrobacter sp. M4]|uniref:Poxvirus protein I5 n=1 Tax=Arthrobacter sp. M4 TaxID=218160 RepID=UPI001CDB64D1|nr:Poxvirus protein I5 [Arthrobacter sp. M4]MCA4135091.1 Poxvirus protein I5 [Arthrobacter sp. M4]
MSLMESARKRPKDEPGVPVNRFTLISETLLTGILVLVLSLPVVTAPAAYAAGVAHLDRHLAGREDSVRSLWASFRLALSGSLKAGATTAAVTVVVVLNLLLAFVGQLPARGVVLPATQAVAAAGAVLLLRTAACWSTAFERHNDGGKGGRGTWAGAFALAKSESLKDWTGTLLLLVALFMSVVFVWMLPALFVVVPGTLILAAASIKMRAATRAAR